MIVDLPSTTTADVSTQAASSAGVVRARKRQPPTAILSIDTMASSTALGTRLNCMTAIHMPAAAESTTR